MNASQKLLYLDDNWYKCHQAETFHIRSLIRANPKGVPLTYMFVRVLCIK